jgi:tetrahydromethanopterin S-methyltransferase subunit C
VGGGGLGRFLVHVCIWHLIWRATLALWRILTFGPVIVVVLVIALVAAGACRSGAGRYRRAGRYGCGTGDGPRGW